MIKANVQLCNVVKVDCCRLDDADDTNDKIHVDDKTKEKHKESQTSSIAGARKRKLTLPVKINQE